MQETEEFLFMTSDNFTVQEDFFTNYTVVDLLRNGLNVSWPMRIEWYKKVIFGLPILRGSCFMWTDY
jgi:hypothetical protein